MQSFRLENGQLVPINPSVATPTLKEPIREYDISVWDYIFCCFVGLAGFALFFLVMFLVYCVNCLTDHLMAWCVPRLRDF